MKHSIGCLSLMMVSFPPELRRNWWLAWVKRIPAKTRRPQWLDRR